MRGSCELPCSVTQVGGLALFACHWAACRWCPFCNSLPNLAPCPPTSSSAPPPCHTPPPPTRPPCHLPPVAAPWAAGGLGASDAMARLPSSVGMCCHTPPPAAPPPCHLLPVASWCTAGLKASGSCTPSRSLAHVRDRSICRCWERGSLLIASSSRSSPSGDIDLSLASLL